ncbi:MAG: 30S ribosomal protein S9, partial [Phycisphaerales bacterium]
MTTATTTATATKGPDSKGWFWGTGRRKTAIARVRVRAGNGAIKLNEKTLDDYLTEDRDRKHVLSVLEKTGTKGKVDVTAGLVGGGFTGQTGAMVMGLARALLAYDSTRDTTRSSASWASADSAAANGSNGARSGAGTGS